MNQSYRKKEFIMFPQRNGFIVFNTKKEFDRGHTHVKNFKIGKTLIVLAIKKELPKNPYMASSLIRISNDKEYIKKLKELKKSIVTHKEFEKLLTERSEIDVSKCT